MEFKVIDNKGKEKGSVQFDETLIATKASASILHEIVVAIQANKRAGSHSVKTRAEVSGSGKKPWRQKGTGRARAGSLRSPLWRKGGVIFGPVPRSYRQDIPKKKKRIAFRLAFNTLITDNRLQVVEPIQISEPKTKIVAEIYKKWNAPTDSFYVVEKIDGNLRRAAGNIPNVKLIDVESLNTYDCLRTRQLYITPAALEKLTDRIKPSQEN